jgi:hypothetical protein
MSEITVHLHGRSEHADFCFMHTGNGGSCEYVTHTVTFPSKRALRRALADYTPASAEEFLRRHAITPQRVMA